MRRALPALLIGSSLLWMALLVAAPFALHAGEQWSTLAAASTYSIGARVCHQRPERSFHIAGRQLPVCARCFGLYASGTFGAVMALGWTRRGALGDARVARMVFGVAALPTLASVALEWAGLWYPGNLTRAIAAAPLGIAAGWAFVRMLADEASLPAAISCQTK